MILSQHFKTHSRPVRAAAGFSDPYGDIQFVSCLQDGAEQTKIRKQFIDMNGQYPVVLRVHIFSEHIPSGRKAVPLQENDMFSVDLSDPVNTFIIEGKQFRDQIIKERQGNRFIQKFITGNTGFIFITFRQFFPETDRSFSFGFIQKQMRHIVDTIITGYAALAGSSSVHIDHSIYAVFITPGNNPVQYFKSFFNKTDLRFILQKHSAVQRNAQSIESLLCHKTDIFFLYIIFIKSVPVRFSITSAARFYQDLMDASGPIHSFCPHKWFEVGGEGAGSKQK